MLSIKLKNGRKARAIILDEAVDGISGLVECAHCDCRVVLRETETEKLSIEIEEFMNGHAEKAIRNARNIFPKLKGIGIKITSSHP